MESNPATAASTRLMVLWTELRIVENVHLGMRQAILLSLAVGTLSQVPPSRNRAQAGGRGGSWHAGVQCLFAAHCFANVGPPRRPLAELTQRPLILRKGSNNHSQRQVLSSRYLTRKFPLRCCSPKSTSYFPETRLSVGFPLSSQMRA
jgi:hypothetical protein